jgi:hypothetical protein
MVYGASVAIFAPRSEETTTSEAKKPERRRWFHFARLVGKR